MAFIRPRLTEHHGLHLAQQDVDFAIPFLHEDLPLYVDPFLLWKSPSLQDQALHRTLLDAFNHLHYLDSHGRTNEAVDQLIVASECHEVGLGQARKGKGQRIGEKTAHEILTIWRDIPHYSRDGMSHIEEVQLFVDNVAKDRISDFTCSFIKSFLIDYTIELSNRYGIPLSSTVVRDVYDYPSKRFLQTETVGLPLNPTNSEPILFVPKRWLRASPWIAFDNYFSQYCPRDKIFDERDKVEERVKVLTFNRHNYDVINHYIKARELQREECGNDPLFSQIPISSAKSLLADIKKLPTGKTENADKRYEDSATRLMASLLYPQLDFADTQVRTDSGVQIRDLIFYNNRAVDFLADVLNDYGSRQIVIELKNVGEVNRDHINQINRYLNNEFGRFGFLLTRYPLTRAMFQNTIDLWAGQRRCIVALDDSDLELMVNIFESKQREPYEVLKKKYIEFIRACPS